MSGLGWRDLLVVCVASVLFALHFILPPPFSRFLSPWFIGAIAVGWIFGHVALDRIERL